MLLSTLQVKVTAAERLGLCLFVLLAVADRPVAMIRLVNAIYGLQNDADWFIQYGKEIFQSEGAFHLLVGPLEKDDRRWIYFRKNHCCRQIWSLIFLKEDYNAYWSEELWGSPQLLLFSKILLPAVFQWNKLFNLVYFRR